MTGNGRPGPDAEAGANRRVLALTGADARAFLQDMVTNDVGGIDRGLVYAALLTPQGKYLADFFLSRQGDAILLDVHAGLADGLAQRIAMYRLRRDATIAATGLTVERGTGPAPADALPDPRHPDMGWRRYGEATATTALADETDWTARRVAQCIPASGVELLPNDTYILEAGFERLHGVDFRKGCYVGQEVTARLKHKTALKKGLAIVALRGDAGPGTPILSGTREAGTLGSRSGDRAIAWLRYDRVAPAMTAGDAVVDMIARHEDVPAGW